MVCYFLTTEVLVKNFAAGTHKKVFGKRLVYLTKLLDDLGFWIEAQKYVTCIICTCMHLTDSSEPIQLPYIERSPTDFKFFQIGDHVRLKFGRPSVH